MEHETPFSFQGDWTGPVVATAVHTGHDLRPELVSLMALPEDDRFREEDPFTDRIGSGITDQVVMHRSRFEVDLNRGRDEAVYRSPDDCWGLQVWHDMPLGEAETGRSLEVYDAFFAGLAERLDALAARGPFVLYDVHSYNHRRDGADAAPSPQEENPEVNVGTGSMDRERFAPVVEAFMSSLSAMETSTGPLDVRENVRFKGANLARWVHERYPGVGCALALEFKKTFMDEWTGQPDEARIDELRDLLAATVQPVTESLGRIDG